MKISELAPQIIEAFGPCSTMYECMTADEVAEEMQNADSILGWLETEIACEEIHHDRFLMRIEDPVRHAAQVRACKEQIAEIKERLAALGYEIA